MWIHSLNEHPGFCLLTAVSNGANTHPQASAQTSTFLSLRYTYLGVELQGHKGALCLALWGITGCVPRRWHHFAFPPPVTEESTSALTLVITAHYYSSRSTGYVLVCFPESQRYWHLFLCLLATCLSLGKDSAGGGRKICSGFYSVLGGFVSVVLRTEPRDFQRSITDPNLWLPPLSLLDDCHHDDVTGLYIYLYLNPL